MAVLCVTGTERHNGRWPSNISIASSCHPAFACHTGERQANGGFLGVLNLFSSESLLDIKGLKFLCMGPAELIRGGQSQHWVVHVFRRWVEHRPFNRSEQSVWCLWSGCVLPCERKAFFARKKWQHWSKHILQIGLWTFSMTYCQKKRFYFLKFYVFMMNFRSCLVIN